MSLFSHKWNLLSELYLRELYLRYLEGGGSGRPTRLLPLCYHLLANMSLFPDKSKKMSISQKARGIRKRVSKEKRITLTLTEAEQKRLVNAHKIASLKLQLQSYENDNATSLEIDQKQKKALSECKEERQSLETDLQSMKRISLQLGIVDSFTIIDYIYTE